MARFLSRWYHHFTWISFTCSFLSLTEGVPQRRMATFSSQYLTFPISGYYSNNFEAEWRISALLPGQNLKISVVSIDIQYHYNCGYDSLTIYDGYYAISPVLAKLCGQLSSLRQTFFTTRSRYAFLRFRSNNYGSGRGFRIQYFIGRSYPPSPAVVHLLATAHDQFLKFPVSGQYANYATNQWLISVLESNQRVRIDFESLAIQYGSNNCGNDALTIYDGLNSSSPRLARLCGLLVALRQKSFKSSSRFFFLRFTSDGFVRDDGFRIRYTSEEEEDEEDDDDETESNTALAGGIPGFFCLLLIICLIVYLGRKRYRKQQRVTPRLQSVGTSTLEDPTSNSATRRSQGMDVFTVNSSVTPPPPYSAVYQDRDPPSYREATQHTTRPSAPDLYPGVV